MLYLTFYYYKNAIIFLTIVNGNYIIYINILIIIKTTIIANPPKGGDAKP